MYSIQGLTLKTLRFFALIGPFVLIQCGGLSSGGGSISSSGGSSVSDAGGSVSDEVVGGNVTELSVTAEGFGVNLADVSDDENVVLFLYSYNQGSTVEGFQVSGDEVSGMFLGTDDGEDSDGFESPETGEGEIEIEGNLDLTEDWHARLREAEDGLIDDDAVPAEPHDAGFARFASTGTQQTFRVLNSFSSSDSYETVTATLRYQNDVFQFYVDDRDADSLTGEDLALLAEDYSAVIPKEREFYGNESDVNGDGRFAVLFTRVVNGLGASSGGIVTGFFYAIDLFDESQYPMSNEMEVFYTFVPDPSGALGPTISHAFALSNILPGVLPHEYQHMISFNQHYFTNGGSAESGWLNEGLSHLAEDVYNEDGAGYMAAAGLENPARVASYLSNVSNICFSCGTSLNQRGGSYLFLRYLYEQAEAGNLSGASSGAEFIRRLLDTSQRSINNVIWAAFGDSGTEEDFKAELGLFGLAVYLSGTGASDDPRLSFNGINLRSIQEDNRGTVISGPAIQTVSALPFTDTLMGNGLTYVEISGQTIRESGGTLNFGFDAGAAFGGYVIRE